MENLELFHTTGGNAKIIPTLWTMWWFLQQSTMGYYVEQQFHLWVCFYINGKHDVQEVLCTRVYSSTGHISVQQWIMDKQTVANTLHRTLLSLQIEGNAGIHYNIHDYWEHCVERNKPGRKGWLCMMSPNWGSQSSERPQRQLVWWHYLGGRGGILRAPPAIQWDSVSQNPTEITKLERE